jgi:hypothetical protein
LPRRGRCKSNTTLRGHRWLGNISTCNIEWVMVNKPLRLRMVLLCLDTTTGPRTAGSLAPHCMGKGSTPDWPGYEVKMIFEVLETLVRRGASTLVAGCSYCWLTASTDCADPASAALSWVSVPLTASVAASSFNCLIPASMFTRPLILSTAAAK